MAFRRAVVPNVGTSTRLLGRTSISSGRSSNTRLMQAARLHGRAVPTASARLATASEAGGAPGSRGFASAVPVDEGSSDSAGQVNSNTRFFRAVEKLDNGVAIIRCVVRSGGAARPSQKDGHGPTLCSPVFIDGFGFKAWFSSRGVGSGRRASKVCWLLGDQ